MSAHTPKHWFLDRWCAELVIDDWMTVSQAARRLGVPEVYVIAAISRVYHRSVVSARVFRWQWK